MSSPSHSGLRPLVGPVDEGQLKYLLTGWTLSQVSPEGEVLSLVLNISPEPVKIFQGTKLGVFTPSHTICTVTEEHPISCASTVTTLSDSLNVELDSSNLSSSQKQELKCFLASFSVLFASPTGALG